MRLLRHACAAAVLAAAILSSPAADLTVLPEGSAAQRIALGNEALMQKRYETAIEHYRRALAVDATSFQALFNLALAYQQLGQNEEARSWYEQANKVGQGHPEVLCNLGVLAFKAGDYAAAADRFGEAARLASESPAEAADYWFNVGTARERLSQWQEAKRAYEECLAIAPAHFGAQYNLGTLYLGPLADQPQALFKSETHLAKARDLAPTRSEPWVNLALVHERTGAGDPDADFAQALKVASGAQGQRVLWQRALFANRQKPPRKIAMRDDLQRILAEDADFPEANGMLGAYCFAIADYDKAIALLEREVAPGHFDAASNVDLESHYLLALIYTDHRPDATKALAHASAYYEQRPDSAKIHELRRRALRLSAGGQ